MNSLEKPFLKYHTPSRGDSFPCLSPPQLPRWLRPVLKEDGYRVVLGWGGGGQKGEGELPAGQGAGLCGQNSWDVQGWVAYKLSHPALMNLWCLPP